MSTTEPGAPHHPNPRGASVRGLAIATTLALLVGGLTATPAVAADAGTIDGAVVLPSGVGFDTEALPFVRLYRWDAGTSAWTQTASDWTAADGTFSFDGLVDGAGYRLSYTDGSGATAPGFRTADGSLAATIAQGADVVVPATVDVVAEPTATVTGTVVFPADYEIDASQPPHLAALYEDSAFGGWGPDRWTEIATDGTFTVRGIRDDVDYRLEYRDESGRTDTGYWNGNTTALVPGLLDAASLPVPATGLVVNVEPPVPSVPAGTIEGTLALPEGVALDPDQLPFVRGYALEGGEWTQAAGAFTDADGSFTLSGLAEGTAVRIGYTDGSGATAPGFLTADGSLGWGIEAGTDVTVPASVALDVAPAVTVTGSVVLPNDYVVDEAQPPHLAALYQDTALGGWGPDRWTEIAADGTFEVTGLRADVDYRLEFRDESGRLTTGYWVADDAALATTLAAGTPLTVPGSGLMVLVAGPDGEPTTFTETPTPTTVGTPKVGVQLRAQVPAWTPVASFDYQWLRDGQPITGATKGWYTLANADLRHRISVRVTGHADGLESASVDSAPTASVSLGTIAKVGTPWISGTAKRGRTLTAKPGTWSAGVRLKYQWFRSGRAISGATSATYTVRSADRGKSLTVRVSGLRDGYASVWRMSAVKRAR